MRVRLSASNAVRTGWSLTNQNRRNKSSRSVGHRLVMSIKCLDRTVSFYLGPSMAVFTLTLVRHGETIANKNRIIQGQQDTELSEVGIRQAELAGSRLQNETFSHVFASDLERAHKTCQIIVNSNKFSKIAVVRDPRLRERRFGVFEGKHSSEFHAAARKQKKSFKDFAPVGAESSKQVRERAISFFQELCQELRALMKDEEGPETPSSVKRCRQSESISSTTGSDVFPFPDPPPEQNSQKETLSLETTTTDKLGHKNSGSTSSSGCSSLTTTESTERLYEHADQSSDQLFSDISPSCESTSSLEDNEGPALLPLQDTDIRTSITAPRNAVYGCPNVSLSPIFEHRLSSISSISSGRNSSFDEGDMGPSLLAEVLVVSHGGILKELLSHFVHDLDCKIPGGNQHALQVSPNCGVSKFTVSLFEEDERPKLTCLHLHDKDHLIEGNVSVLSMENREST